MSDGSRNLEYTDGSLPPLTREQRSAGLKAQRQKRYYERKKEKMRDLEQRYENTAECIASIQAENEHLSAAGIVYGHLLRISDYITGIFSRGAGHGQGQGQPAAASRVVALNSDMSEMSLQRTDESDACQLTTASSSHFVSILTNPEDFHDGVLTEIIEQSSESIVEMDKLWLELIVPACKQLVAKPSDISAREDINRWARRRRKIISELYYKRPHCLLELASMRILPLGSRMTLNPCLLDLPIQIKLTPVQYGDMKVKWEHYKIKIKEYFSRVSQAVQLPLNALDLMLALKQLDELQIIQAQALVEYFCSFVDSLTMPQRAAMLVACAPYAPDVLQISAILFDDGQLYCV